MADKVSLSTLSLAKAYTDEHGGGGGGTSNYNDLTHKPTVNGVEFKGTMTSETLGLVSSEDLGDLATKDSASGTITPKGTVTVSQGTDTTASVGSITDVGTLPTLVVDGTKLKFVAGELPTKSDVTVVTASGTRSASFSGTQETVPVS